MVKIGKIITVFLILSTCSASSKKNCNQEKEYRLIKCSEIYRFMTLVMEREMTTSTSMLVQMDCACRYLGCDHCSNVGQLKDHYTRMDIFWEKLYEIKAEFTEKVNGLMMPLLRVPSEIAILVKCLMMVFTLFIFVWLIRKII